MKDSVHQLQTQMVLLNIILGAIMCMAQQKEPHRSAPRCLCPLSSWSSRLLNVNWAQFGILIAMIGILKLEKTVYASLCSKLTLYMIRLEEELGHVANDEAK